MAKKTKSTLGKWSDAYTEPARADTATETVTPLPAASPIDESRRLRETYYLSADVIEAVRDAAVHLGQPKGDIVETALRSWLASQQIPPRTRRVRRGRPVE